MCAKKLIVRQVLYVVRISASIVISRPPESLVLNNPDSFAVAVVLVDANEKAFGLELIERTERIRVTNQKQNVTKT